MSDGPKTSIVRATLAGRPAGILDAIDNAAARCFAGLFSGASQSNAYVTSTGRFWCGKAECEWGWPKDWETLRVAGLIDFSTAREDAPGATGGYRINVTWSITEKGWLVREDDLAFYNEIVGAMRDDRAALEEKTI